MVSPLEISAITWAVAPIASYLVNKLDLLKGPLERMQADKKDLEKLEDNLLQIQAIASAAEALKDVTDDQAKILRKIKNAIYDAEDVIDEYDYQRLANHPRSSVKKIPYRFFNADDLKKRLLEAIGDLEKAHHGAKTYIKVVKIKKAALAGQSSMPQQAHMACYRATTSKEHEQIFVGRDADIKNIVVKIKEQADCSSAPPLVISVVGIGGIGKTTLAQKVYNHEEIASNVFEVKKMWVNVANTFDHDTVTKLILANIKGKNIDCDSLDTVQNEISKELGSKKFLLILDDVWVEEDENEARNRETWKMFLSSFDKCKGGSSIMVTTRLESVVKMFSDCTQMKFTLTGLSRKDSNDLFKSHAFPSYNSGATRSKELEAIGEKIVDKLFGLPLALKVIGMHLSSKRSVKDWDHVHKNIELAAGDVIKILKLSYDHLPSHLKPCFGYCSLFPKGYRFTENEINQLIHMWIAQGFIYNMDGSECSLEDIGRSYFDNLCSGSFFQPTDVWYVETTVYVMHDLINDLAQFVSREECWQIQSHRSSSPSTQFRHVSVSCTDLHILSTSTNIQLDKLRTLLVLNSSKGHVCTQMEDTTLGSLKRVRVLDLSRCCNKQLPETIQNMIHLRYLAFKPTSALLPKTCSTLFNLEVVVMRTPEPYKDICKKGLDYCAPREMSRLKNLRHVYVLDWHEIEIPGHCKIPHFHGNGVFSVNHGNKLEYIKNMRFHGDLAIRKLENVSSKQDAIKEIVCQNEHIKALKLKWSSTATSKHTADFVLEALKPPSNLSRLAVDGYPGSKCPSWLKDNYLTSLSSLNIGNCRKLRELPPLGQLPNLEELELLELNAVKEISPEFYGKDAVGFPSLTDLTLERMQNLEEWSFPESRSLFPLLERVHITKCSKLRIVPNIFRLTKDYISLHTDDLAIEAYEHKEALVLEWSSNVTSRRTDDNVLVALQQPSNLSRLAVDGYPGSKGPSWLMDNYLTNLSSLCLTNCRELRELPPLGQLPNLEELELLELNAVKEISPEFYGNDAVGFPSLKVLKLEQMQNLEEWSFPESRSLFPLLEEVQITKCSKLRRVPNISRDNKGYINLYTDDGSFSFGFVPCAPTSSSGGQDNVELIRKLGRDFEYMRIFWKVTDCRSDLEYTRIFWKVTDCSGFKFVSCDIKALCEVQTCKLEVQDFHWDFHSHPEAVKDLYVFNCSQPLQKLGFTKLSSLERLELEPNFEILDLEYCKDDDDDDDDDDDVALLPTSLKSLRMSFYSAKSNFFSRCFRSLSSLVQLELVYISITNVDIIDLHWLTSLTELRIIDCNHLMDINGLKALTCLTTMEIIESPDLSYTISQYEFLKPLSSLSTLKISDLDFDSSEDVILDLQHSRGLRVLHISRCQGKFKLINCNALTLLTELVIDECPGLIIEFDEFCFLKCLDNLELKLNDWAPPFLSDGSLLLSTGAPVPEDIPMTVARKLILDSEPISMDFHPVHQTILLVGTCAGDIELWDVGTRERLVLRNFTVWELSQCSKALQGPFVKDPIVKRIIWSPDGSLFGVAYSKHVVQIYSYHGGSDIRQHLEIDAHTGGVNDIAFSHPNNRLCVITCGDDKTIKVWDATSGVQQYTFEGHDAPVYAVCPHHKENIHFILSTAMDGKIKALLYENLGSRFDYGACGDRMTMTYSADGTRLFLCGASKDSGSFIVELNESEGTVKRMYQGLTKRMSRVVRFDTTKNRYLAAVDNRSVIKFWDVDNSNLLMTLYIDAEGGLESSPRIRFNKEGTLLAVSSNLERSSTLEDITLQYPIKILANIDGLRLLRTFEGQGRPFEASRAISESNTKTIENPLVTTAAATSAGASTTEAPNTPQTLISALNGDIKAIVDIDPIIVEDPADKSKMCKLKEISGPPQCRCLGPMDNLRTSKLLKLDRKRKTDVSTPLMAEQILKDGDDTLGSDGSSLLDLIIPCGTKARIFVLDTPHDLFGTRNSIVITHKDIKDIVEKNWLNVSVIQLYILKLYNGCQEKSIPNIGFMDPGRINATYCAKEKQATINYIAETMQSHQTIFAPYFENKHWVLLVIKPREGTVHVLDSLNDKNYIIKDAFAQAMQGAATFRWITDFPSPKQDGGFECGYYVMNLMQDIITTYREFPKGRLPQKYTMTEIDSVSQSWQEFFLKLFKAKAFRIDYQQSTELPIAAEEPEEECGNEVQETKREDKAEGRNSDCRIDEIAKRKGYPLVSYRQPSRSEKRRKSDASALHMREYRLKDVEHDQLGPGGLSLHDWIVAHGTSERTLEFQPPLDLFGRDNKIVITHEDINDLKKVDWLNVSIIQLYMMKLYNICAKENIPNISFLDPARINATQLSTEKQAAVTYMAETKQSQQTILAPYFEDHHWVLLVIKPSEETVYILDSLSSTRVKNYLIKDALMQAFSPNMRWIIHESPQQTVGFECGYYVMILMEDIITKCPEFPKGTLPQYYSDPEINSVRQSWIKFFLEEAKCEGEAKNRDGGPQVAEQKMEIDEQEAIQDEDLRSE